jgi:LexA-binding, inner membrane-associated putative hydrolase
MPNYKGHIVGAFGVYCLVLIACAFYYLPGASIIQWLLCTIAGGLFPDIDIKSKGQQFFYKILLTIVALCALYKLYHVALFLCFFSFLPLMVKHRGLFHHLWFLIALVACASEALSRFLPAYRNAIAMNSLFFLLGIISHLWLDMGFRKMVRFR